MSTQIDFKQVASLDLPPMTTISSFVNSNHIFMYGNEEFLLALSCVGFIIYSQKTLGESLNTTSDTQSEALLFELQQFISFQEALLSELKVRHELCSISLCCKYASGWRMLQTDSARCVMPTSRAKVLAVLWKGVDTSLRCSFSY